MIDPQNWNRYWDYAFVGTKNDIKLNIKECQAYLEYLETRYVLLQWDKYPLFEDENLTL